MRTSDPPLAPRPSRTVVYIEDNPSNIALMKDLLADFERVELITAPTAEIGVEIVRSQRPDVVIMDIQLPGMSGFEAMRRLQQWPETREIPVIGLTTAARVQGSAGPVHPGIHRSLEKPLKVEELLATLEKFLTPHTAALPA